MNQENANKPPEQQTPQNADIPNEAENTKTPEKKTDYNLALGIALGLSLGTALGVVFNNIGMFTGLGLCMGVAIGLIQERKKKK